jgi:hypothetical protein
MLSMLCHLSATISDKTLVLMCCVFTNVHAVRGNITCSGGVIEPVHDCR